MDVPKIKFTIEELATAEWRTIPNYDGLYSVSNLGHIYSHRQHKIMKTSPAGAGYLQLRLCNSTGQIHCYVHYLVALAFLGPRPDNHEVNHKDTNRLNNRATNLEYLTKPEHNNHTQSHGLIPKGINHWNASLSEDDIRAIFASNEHPRILATWYSISRPQIYAIQKGRR